MLSTLQPQLQPLVLTHDISRRVYRRPSAYPLPPLPNELVHLIFEFAASQHHNACRALCLVSYGTRMVALPYLMKTILILEENHWILDELVQTVPARSVGKSWISPMLFTKNIWLAPFIGPERDPHGSKLQLIFSRCPNVNNIALSGATLQQLTEGHVCDMLVSREFQITVHAATLAKHNLLLVGGCERGHPFVERINNLALGTVPDPSIYTLELSPFTSLLHLTLNFFGSSLEQLELLTMKAREYDNLQEISIALPTHGSVYSRSHAAAIEGIVRSHQASDSRLIISKITNMSWRGWYEKSVNTVSN